VRIGVGDDDSLGGGGLVGVSKSVVVVGEITAVVSGVGGVQAVKIKLQSSTISSIKKWCFNG